MKMTHLTNLYIFLIPLNFSPMTTSPHFVIVPLVAQGHIIPMLDLAHLLAVSGATVSFITTPINAARIKPVIDRATNSNLAIRFIEFDFPGKETGVPDGIENFDQLTDRNMFLPFFEALTLFRDPLRRYLQSMYPKASCMITDYCNCWTAEIAREMNVRRLIFHGPSCFYILATRNIYQSKAYDSVADSNELVVVPGLPQRIEVTRGQAPGWFAMMKDMKEKAFEAEETADGVVMNTFQELEHDYVELYRQGTKKLILPIGPLSLYNKDMASKSTRGNKSSVDEARILNWLDTKAKKSVILLSFGTIIRTRPTQLIETGRALEASKYSFIWVIKEVEMCRELEELMAGGFRERTKERVQIITGWAPQVVILSHGAVGGFVTHCGWNSTLEAVTAGVPMITWPHFADQFLNEKLIVEVLRVGVSVGNKVPVTELKEGEVMAKREMVEMAIEKLMGGGKEAEERRVKAEEYGEMAVRAMGEGGSSYENLRALIKFAMACTL